MFLFTHMLAHTNIPPLTQQKSKRTLTSMPRNALANLDLDKVIERIANGEFQNAIAHELGVTPPALHYKLKAHSERHLAAREMGIESRLEKAEREIQEAPDQLNLARAREAFRATAWRAEREFPARWGQRTHHVVEQVGDLGERLRRAKERTIEGESVAITPNDAPHMLANPANDDSD